MNETSTLFHQDWMLDAAALGRGQKAEVRWDGLLVAEMPYFVYKNFGTRTIGQHPYCRVSGPIFHLPRSSPVRQLSNRLKLIRELELKLPSHDRFLQAMAPEFDESAAFTLAGYEVVARYTVRIDPRRKPDEVLKGMRGSTRRDIVTTFDRLETRRHTDLDQFLSLAREHGRQSRFQLQHIQSIFEVALKRNQTILISAYDSNGVNMGTCIILYDHSVAYFWLAARHLVEGNRAYSRLIFEGYKFAQEAGLIFDMDGYGTNTSALFLANFGGDLVMRNQVRKAKIWVEGMLLVKKFLEQHGVPGLPSKIPD